MTEVGHWGFWVCVCPALWPLDLCVCVCVWGGWVRRAGTLCLYEELSQVARGLLCVHGHTRTHISCSQTLTLMFSHKLAHTYSPAPCPPTCTHHAYSLLHTNSLLVPTFLFAHVLAHTRSLAAVLPSHIHVHHSMPAHSCTWTYSHAVHTHVLTHMHTCSRAGLLHPCAHPPTPTVCCWGACVRDGHSQLAVDLAQGL